jgi:alkylhydroperoxidase family enzyme
MPPQILAGLLDDLDKAEIDEKLKPVLAYIRKLTLTPTRMTQGDADAVFAAGWSEQALYDAIQVCCLFNFMNRFVEGIGLEMSSEQLRLRGAALQEHGYVGMIEALQLDR